MTAALLQKKKCCCEGQGACCLPDGSCVQDTEQSCLNRGGVFQGLGVGCEPNPCIAPDCCEIVKDCCWSYGAIANVSWHVQTPVGCWSDPNILCQDFIFHGNLQNEWVCGILSDQRRVECVPTGDRLWLFVSTFGVSIDSDGTPLLSAVVGAHLGPDQSASFVAIWGTTLFGSGGPMPVTFWSCSLITGQGPVKINGCDDSQATVTISIVDPVPCREISPGVCGR